MSVRLVCAICGRELHRIGVTRQVVCPLHGSRGTAGALTEPGSQKVPKPYSHPGSVSSPSKPGLRDPDFDFGTSTDA